jgi:hypothetical protein
MAGLVLLALAPLTASGRTPDSTSCEVCHANPALFPEEQRDLPARFASDVHATVGLSCHDCHGGDPDPALAGDRARAMDRDHPGHAYRGVPAREEIPAFCGRCHSDPIVMREFQPDPRVDQEREYATSRHGIALAQGDTKVATCVDCHGAHDSLRVDDTRSRVHPTRVADTCSACHSDPARMAGYRTEDGSPLPVDQYAGWRGSAHAAALLERADLSAPTCNDCHGKHGARPPGLDSLAFVCGSCHGREVELFRDSPKQRGFQRHNELYLAGGAGPACGDCHVPPEPQAELMLRRFSECATCHGNHRVLRPTIAMLSPLPATPCALCHESSEASGADAQDLMPVRVNYESTRDRLLDQAQQQELEGDALFDWMVERVFALPPHLRTDTSLGGEKQPLPSVARLFQRFRIGPIRPRVPLPGGGVMEAPVVRCSDCHAESPLLAGSGHAHQTGRDIVERMRELTVVSARAERTLLAAHRGGVEVRGSLTPLDRALAAEIELQALVHGFRTDPPSAFVSKQQEGLEHAREALAGGHAAIEDLESRRRGLAVALVLIVLVLVALGLRIRRIPTRSEGGARGTQRSGPG